MLFQIASVQILSYLSCPVHCWTGVNLTIQRLLAAWWVCCSTSVKDVSLTCKHLDVSQRRLIMLTNRIYLLYILPSISMNTCFARVRLPSFCLSAIRFAYLRCTTYNVDCVLEVPTSFASFVIFLTFDLRFRFDRNRFTATRKSEFSLETRAIQPKSVST